MRHPARVHGQPLHPPSPLRRDSPHAERGAGPEGPRQPRPGGDSGRGAPLPVRAEGSGHGGAGDPRPRAASGDGAPAGLGRGGPGFRSPSRGLRSHHRRCPAARRRCALRRAAGAARDRHVPPLRPAPSPRPLAPRRDPQGGEAGDRAVRASRPRELAQGGALGPEGRADTGPRGEDGALPRSARRGRGGRRPAEGPRSDPGPGVVRPPPRADGPGDHAVGDRDRPSRTRGGGGGDGEHGPGGCDPAPPASSRPPSRPRLRPPRRTPSSS